MKDMATEEPESVHKEAESGEETPNILFAKRCCCCIPFFGTERSRTAGLVWWEKVPTAENEERWWARGLKAVKKLREWSEIVAGPKWKTFIRRFNRTRSGGVRHGKFQYDPLSYALNFDEGPGQNGHFEDEDSRGFRDFSARYAPVPVSAKTSVDLGKDVPVFT